MNDLVNNQEKEILKIITSLILDNLEKDGTDILLGKFNKKIKNLDEEKIRFDKICESGLRKEPEIQMILSKYLISNKEYYHIEILKNSNNVFENITKRDYISERQERLIKLIKENPYIKYDEMAKKLNIAKSTITHDIKNLKEKKILDRIGTNEGKWEINMKK